VCSRCCVVLQDDSLGLKVRAVAQNRNMARPWACARSGWTR
jgi:branched-subunit amino acid ABC-type transport system permease component